MAWVEVCGTAENALEKALESRVQAHISSEDYHLRDIEYVGKLKRSLVNGRLQVSDRELEQLRRLCQLWEVDLKAGEISSHRKIIGPCIVAAKRILLRLVQVIFKKSLRQQRDFNAAVITYLAELSQARSAE